MNRTLQVGVKAVIRDDDGRMLLVKRARPYESETEVMWEIPGGRIDIGETTTAALKREIKEETGLDLASVERILGVQDILRNPKLHVVRITYLARATGELAVNHSDDSDTQHTDAAWFTLDELPTILIDPILTELLPQLDTSPPARP